MTARTRKPKVSAEVAEKRTSRVNALDASVCCPLPAEPTDPDGPSCGEPVLAWSVKKGTPMCGKCRQRTIAKTSHAHRDDIEAFVRGASAWIAARMGNPELMNPLYIAALSEWYIHYTTKLAASRNAEDFDRAIDLHGAISRHARTIEIARRALSQAQMTIQSFHPVIQFVARFIDDLLTEFAPPERADEIRQSFRAQLQTMLIEFDAMSRSATVPEDDVLAADAISSETVRQTREHIRIEKSATRKRKQRAEDDT